MQNGTAVVQRVMSDWRWRDNPVTDLWRMRPRWGLDTYVMAYVAAGMTANLIIAILR